MIQHLVMRYYTKNEAADFCAVVALGIELESRGDRVKRASLESVEFRRTTVMPDLIRHPPSL